MTVKQNTHWIMISCTVQSDSRSKERLRAQSVKFLTAHSVLASVLAGTTPLARSGEFTGLDNREPLLLDTRRGEREIVGRSLFGGGGAEPLSQIASQPFLGRSQD